MSLADRIRQQAAKIEAANVKTAKATATILDRAAKLAINNEILIEISAEIAQKHLTD